MTAIGTAILIALIFTASSLIALFGSVRTTQGRMVAVAIAAGVLLTLAFGDLFPESLELAGKSAVVGFVGMFALLFLIESWTRAHMHHVPEEHVHNHAHLPFIFGLILHNLADGFAVGISARLSERASSAVGFGVLVHQLPVGVSFVAVLAAAHLPQRSIVRLSALLGTMIPLATTATLVLPPVSNHVLGILLSVAGGTLAYVSTAHLLPEAQAEHPSRVTGMIFAGTVVFMTISLFTVLAE